MKKVFPALVDVNRFLVTTKQLTKFSTFFSHTPKLLASTTARHPNVKAACVKASCKRSRTNEKEQAEFLSFPSNNKLLFVCLSMRRWFQEGHEGKSCKRRKGTICLCVLLQTFSPNRMWMALNSLLFLEALTWRWKVIQRHLSECYASKWKCLR